MNSRIAAKLIAACCLVSPCAFGQDVDAAAERARLANERIALLEAEARAREEALVREQADETPTSGPINQDPPQVQRPIREKETPEPSAVPDVSRSLEQIRTLGELRDAGYVTPDEFEKIKKRILSDL